MGCKTQRTSFSGLLAGQKPSSAGVYVSGRPSTGRLPMPEGQGCWGQAMLDTLMTDWWPGRSGALASIKVSTTAQVARWVHPEGGPHLRKVEIQMSFLDL